MNKRTKVSAMAAIGIGLSGVGLLGIHGAEAPAAAPVPTSVAVDARAEATTPSPVIEAVIQAFPVEATITRAVRTGAGAATTDELLLAAGGDQVYEVTLYGRFARTELAALDLVGSSTDAWVGADDADLTSIYVAGTGGTGLRLGSSPTAGRPASPDRLLAMARALLDGGALDAVRPG